MRVSPEPSLFVIFGGTGDLARRKLLPALARLAHAELLGNCHVVGVSRSADQDDEIYRAWVRSALDAAGLPDGAKDSFCTGCVHYQSIGKGTEADFEALSKRLSELDAAHGLEGNRAFYLSLPPKAFEPTMKGLAGAGLNASAGWTRLVVEKPFGRDLTSARALNEVTHRYFGEEQIYRIDHYLGKETVQNLLVFRFANAIFEPMWNRDRVESVMITVSESLGVGTRAGYYDGVGALRDMVQNHLAQLLTLVAMEPPVSLSADAIRAEKIKVLRSLAPIRPDDYVRGQYTSGVVDGEEVPGYLDADGVPSDSTTETFVALRARIDNWRWQGVPFFLRTGKRLGKRTTSIAIRFRGAPVGLFREAAGASARLDTEDVLVITLQPNEGFSLHLDVKVPGSPLRLERIPLSFRYGDRFEQMPDAYQTLLHDVMTGDQTLFVHGDEVEESWRVFAPMLDNADRPHPYAAGSWGPNEAEHMSVGDKTIWRQ